jgi:Na+-translocating ferredoxin:NAD+ oxidoreductase RnfC subunit
VILRVPIGASILKCIEAARPTLKEYAAIIGGPMMGRMAQNKSALLNAVVTKTVGIIIVLPPGHYLARRAGMTMDQIRSQTRSACIQCRMCTDLCPRYLIGHQIHPHLVMRNLWREKTITSEDGFKAAFGDAANCCDCGVCEMYACPMGLSPRKVNGYIKGVLQEKGIKVDRNMDCRAKPELEYRRIPTERLAARLGLSGYSALNAHKCLDIEPQEVYIPFRQHIGNPSVPCKSIGDRVACGELLACAAQNGLSANIHASIGGVIVSVDRDGVKISRKED